MSERFSGRGYLVDIFHDPIEGHFIARFLHDAYTESPDGNAKAHFFDIRGDVTDLYKEEDLENVWLMSLYEERRYGRLMCDCREFIEPDNYPIWLKEND